MNKHIDYLDALRGYAILGVITTHITVQYTGLWPVVENIGRNGYRGGGQLFFLVSAFTLMMSLHRKGQLQSADFFRRRFFRIAPAFYAAFIFYFIFNVLKYLTGVPGEAGRYTLSNIIGTLSSMSVIRQEWLFSLVPGG